MPDQKTLFGVDYNNRKKLITEDITEKNSKKAVNEHADKIWNLVYNEFTNTLIAGDYTGKVIEYKRKGAEWEVLKTYPFLGIGYIISSFIIGNLVIFGGHNNIRVVDMEKGEVLGDAFTTAMGWINSIQVCRVEINNDNKYVLCVSGYSVDYSENKSDIYDITETVMKYANVKKENNEVADLENKLKDLKVDS